MFENLRARIFQNLAKAASAKPSNLQAAAPPLVTQPIPAPVAQGFWGPGQSLPQIAPAGTQPRTLDYPFQTNINYTPRKQEPITFEHMRELARENELIRIILEKVKSRIACREWEFRLKAKPGDFKGKVIEQSKSDPRVAALTKMFQYPDGDHDWQTWCSGLLEDRYVIDAASLWMERDKAGKIQNIVQINGALINRIIDAEGRTPRPPYVAYQQTLKNMPAVNLRADDLLYAVSNYRAHKIYGYSEIEQTITFSRTQINRARWTLDHYTQGNIPEVFAMFDSAKWTPEQIKAFMATFESYLNGDSGARQRVYPLPDGQIHEMRGKELFEEFDEWIARVFCYQMGETPTAFVKAVNRATSNQMADSAEESGEAPTLQWLQGTINRIVQHPYYFGYDDIEWAILDETEVDPLIQAQVDQINIPLGVTTVDEARERDNKAPLNDENPKPGANSSPAQKSAGKKKASSPPPLVRPRTLFSVPRENYKY